MLLSDINNWATTLYLNSRVIFSCLYIFSYQVKLYDDCDKLLESKIVKLDDAVRSGETLTFGVYLVDIGDPHGESKPIPNPILQRDKTMADRDGTLKNSKLNVFFYI